jgi:hypothetical protein
MGQKRHKGQARNLEFSKTKRGGAFYYWLREMGGQISQYNLE